MKKLFGVIGDPIAHSMSPIMHNDLFGYYDIDASYLPFHVHPTNLEEAIKGFKAIGAGGFNVTVPHKTAIIPHLDVIDPLASAIGAVNTVVNEEGLLTGYNTDGRGFVRAFTDRCISLTGKNVLIIGAGGAAKAIYFSMAEAGVKNIDICNRTLVKAEELVEACPYSVQSNLFEVEKAQKRIEEYDLVIQTTSIGMAPQFEETPLVFTNLKNDCIVTDIIYNPLKTRFLRNAEAMGASIFNGLDMFVYQGALAFEMWTGVFPGTERMKDMVLNQLGGSTC
ncbi:shikimate dehydrogenase [Bacillus sp. B15-48]|uniref:shikimate dehydrogenase n=1 Tax=Bacillus sp. B15-48 TaxID=1548601 RepID=UPI00193F0CAF|nr:shikimate dehydrogenase [Bacillus sp. B15-48]MBM4762367.1 shikimate dehydrogenase [Bacillus sp. B15-48]